MDLIGSGGIHGRRVAWIRGAMVARLTPDQKVACSIDVGFNTPVQFGFLFSFYFLPVQSRPPNVLFYVVLGQASLLLYGPLSNLLYGPLFF